MTREGVAASAHDCGICEALRVLPTWKRWWYRIAYGLYPAHHPPISEWRVKS